MTATRTQRGGKWGTLYEDGFFVPDTTSTGAAVAPTEPITGTLYSDGIYVPTVTSTGAVVTSSAPPPPTFSSGTVEPAAAPEPIVAPAKKYVPSKSAASAAVAAYYRDRDRRAAAATAEAEREEAARVAKLEADRLAREAEALRVAREETEKREMLARIAAEDAERARREAERAAHRAVERAANVTVSEPAAAPAHVDMSAAIGPAAMSLVRRLALGEVAERAEAAGGRAADTLAAGFAFGKLVAETVSRPHEVLKETFTAPPSTDGVFAALDKRAAGRPDAWGSTEGGLIGGTAGLAAELAIVAAGISAGAGAVTSRDAVLGIASTFVPPAEVPSSVGAPFLGDPVGTDIGTRADHARARSLPPRADKEHAREADKGPESFVERVEHKTGEGNGEAGPQLPIHAPAEAPPVLEASPLPPVVWPPAPPAVPAWEPPAPPAWEPPAFTLEAPATPAGPPLPGHPMIPPLGSPLGAALGGALDKVKAAASAAGEFAQDNAVPLGAGAGAVALGAAITTTAVRRRSAKKSAKKRAAPKKKSAAAKRGKAKRASAKSAKKGAKKKPKKGTREDRGGVTRSTYRGQKVHKMKMPNGSVRHYVIRQRAETSKSGRKLAAGTFKFIPQ